MIFERSNPITFKFIQLKKNLRLIIIILCVRVASGFQLAFPQDSRNGYWLPVKDTLRILLVYAEVVNDPDEPGTVMGWRQGELPPEPGYFFESEIREDGDIKGMLTKYFHEASFGEYVLLGDYYPRLVSLDYSNLKGDGFYQVVEVLDTTPGEDIFTAEGLSLLKGDFDLLSTAGRYGDPKDHKPDNRIDMMMVLWRVNSRITTQNSAGYCVPAVNRRKLKSAEGFNAYSCFVIKGARAYMGIRHEFSHTILGPNNFHSGGSGAGVKTFMSSAGGWSMLSSWDRSSPVYNAFDRRRMGWKPGDNQFYISCRDPLDGSELNGDLSYGQDFNHGSNEFILRDFVTAGDAIRISLPYVNNDSTPVNRQWLWLENHQMKEGIIDHSPKQTRGIYAYIQVGKETLDGAGTYSGNCNYTWPLSAFGNYDFIVDTDSGSLTVDESLENPFSGYNLLINQAMDFNPRDKLIYRNELFFPEKVIIKDAPLGEEYFNYKTYPVFGSILNAFIPGMKISMADNPAAVPVLTYRTSNSPRARPGNPAAYDNRHIYLNGISIEILEQYANGDVRIRIRWDDYLVDGDARWCGDIILYEEIIMKQKSRIRIDQGLTPQRPKDPVEFKGNMIFAEPSSLTCLDGSRFILEKKSNLILVNNSTLILEPGSFMEIGKHARLIIDESSSLIVKPGAELVIKGKILPTSKLSDKLP